MRELVEWGVPFDRAADGEPALAREGAHSVRRVLHAGDATGREIGRTLWRAVRAARASAYCTTRWRRRSTSSTASVGACASFVTTVRGRGTSAAPCCSPPAAPARCSAKRRTPPWRPATASRWRTARRAGGDLEFVQFHPTALSAPGAPRFLLSEALRGEGARLVNADGEPFMERYDPAGDLAPRDVVAPRSSASRCAPDAPVYLSLAHLDADRVRARFPTIARGVCRGVGLDLARDPLPVGPAAHYMMGGVDTDLMGRTSLPGLFAAGEVACTGVHGANRLASNSLLEGLVFGARAADGDAGSPPTPARLRADDRRSGRSGCPGAAGGPSRPLTACRRAGPDVGRRGARARRRPGSRRTLDRVGEVSRRLEAGLFEAAARAGWDDASIALVALARGAGGAPPRGEPRRASACGFPGPRRSTLEGSRRRPRVPAEGHDEQEA